MLRCTLDADGNILEVNAIWLKALGFKEKATLGKKFAEFVDDEDLEINWPAFPALSKSDKGKRTAQVTLLSKNNQNVYVELSATQLEEPRSKEARYLISMVDVTEKQLAFERKDELERANEGLSTFAYIASHDLQEPLRKIRQYVDMLQAENLAQLDKDGQFYLNVITGSAARISHLVKDILAYTTASNADIDIIDLELNDIIDEVIEEASDVIAETSTKISVGKLPKTQGDWGAVKLLFQNLLSNAIKYQADNQAPKVSIKGRALKGRYVIDVTDNGIGVDEGGNKNIFDPFVRLHSKFEFAGTGIGLAICNEVCQRMGWHISHKPNPKGGTIFSVTIKNPE
jgi:PAS domain S-box-containing protein